MRGLPPAFEGIRIALLTDIHLSALVPADDVSRAVAMANSEQPDLVILGGDYVTRGDRRFVEPVAELLAPLRAREGVFGVLGNHDDNKYMPTALRRRGVTILRDRLSRIERKGDTLTLGGIDFWTRDVRAISKALNGAREPLLLLAHDPMRLIEAAALGVPAVLSGHTHGGQIVIPGVGPLAARKYPVSAGLATRGPTNMYVSRGIGTVYVPIRINCPPEVSIITLTSSQAQDAPQSNQARD
jgi:predicted MPP superfamily phosphohydrolase